MKQPVRIYKLFSLINLDVVTGAVGFVYTANSLFPVEISVYQVFILSSTVWIIYTSDRILDNLRNPQVATLRHLFQSANKKISMFLLLVLASVNVLLLIVNKPQKLILGGMALSAAILIYLFVKQLLSARKIPFLFKEVFIASGYSAGIMLLPWSNSRAWPLNWNILTGYLFLIALMNIFVIGSFEKKDDMMLGEKSLVYFIHPAWLKNMSVFVSAVAVFMAITLLKNHPVAISLVLIPILLIVPLLYTERFTNRNLYRLWADGVLMLPIPVLVFNSFLYF